MFLAYIQYIQLLISIIDFYLYLIELNNFEFYRTTIVQKN